MTLSKNNPPAGLIDRVAGAINEADEQAATERVADLRAKYPDVEVEALIGLLIKQKCLGIDPAGAITSSASVIPEVGVFVSLIFGLAADIAMTARIQAELILEIAAAYNRELSEAEKQSALIMVANMSADANQLLAEAEQEIAQKAAERLAGQSGGAIIPVLGAAKEAGATILSTYIVGHRTGAYFNPDSDAVEAWENNIKAIFDIDDRTIGGWLAETTTRSWRLVCDTTQTATGIVTVVRKSAGEIVIVGAENARAAVTGAGKVGEMAATTGRSALKGTDVAAKVMTTAGRKTGESLTAGADKVAQVTANAGRGVARGAEAAAGAVTGAGKKVGDGLAAGADKVGAAATGAGRSVAKGTETAAGAIAGAGKIAGQGMTTGAGKAGELAIEAGRGVVKGVGAAAGTVTDAGKMAAAGAGKVGGIAKSIFQRTKSKNDDASENTTADR